MKLRHFLATAVPTLFLASTAQAVRQPDDLVERPLETAQGGPARLARDVAAATPASAAGAWRDFLGRHGAWHALWDADTEVPLRIFGEGIDAPGSLADPAIAERAARAALADEVALLAPGANPADFVVEANLVRGGIRQVRLGQTWRGMTVVGAHVSFTFEHDRLVELGSTAARDVGATLPASMISRDDAAARARDWIDSVYGASAVPLGTADAVVLPIVRSAGKGGTEYRVVVPVVVDQAEPRAKWNVYVDAASGAPVARYQTLEFATGTVKFHVPIRWPGGGFEDAPAPNDNHMVDGASTTSTAAGVVSWSSGTTASVTPGLTGTRVRIQDSGTLATASLPLDPDGEAVWDESTSSTRDAQLTGFIRINEAKQYAYDHIDSGLAMLSTRMDVNTNVDGTCNAFYDPGSRSLNFFPASTTMMGTSCNNTGELSDVMRHEFGHGLQHAAAGTANTDGALGEGQADYYAATMAGDPGMGLGFFTADPTTPLRQIDPDGREARWPEDVSEIHETGRIISGALWDLRKAAVAEMGETDGVAFANAIYYGIIARADDIPSSYAEALAVDDDNGNLADGVPHQCLIDQAFGAHGLGTEQYARQIDAPIVDGMTLTLTQLPAGPSGCVSSQVSGATATWRLQSDPTVTGTVDFVPSDSDFTATLPAQADGTVVEYQVQAVRDTGGGPTFPVNAADPWYQLYVGPVTPIYCTDFENDPAADGWQLTGFSWGAPVGNASSLDPTAAASGAKVIGINLAGDYQSDGSYNAVSPSINVAGYSHVRLQYRRWLGVEDSQYDHATIAVDGANVWENATEDDGLLYHTDREWRFQDIDLSTQAADGTVQVSYGLTADGGLEFGGWTVDDFCIVGIGVPVAACGDGALDDGEQCDDGNLADGDGCSSACVTEQTTGCCSASGGGAGDAAGPLLLGLGLAAVVVRRRRRA